jgi:hypothetical protein
VEDVLDLLKRSRDKLPHGAIELPRVTTSMGTAGDVATSTTGVRGNSGTAVVTQTPSGAPRSVSPGAWSITQIAPRAFGHPAGRALLAIAGVIAAALAVPAWIYSRRRRRR